MCSRSSLRFASAALTAPVVSPGHPRAPRVGRSQWLHRGRWRGGQSRLPRAHSSPGIPPANSRRPSRWPASCRSWLPVLAIDPADRSRAPLPTALRRFSWFDIGRAWHRGGFPTSAPARTALRQITDGSAAGGRCNEALPSEASGLRTGARHAKSRRPGAGRSRVRRRRHPWHGATDFGSAPSGPGRCRLPGPR